MMPVVAAAAVLSKAPAAFFPVPSNPYNGEDDNRLSCTWKRASDSRSERDYWGVQGNRLTINK